MNIKFNRRFLIRTIALVVVLLFGVLMYFVGRQHTILLDNKTVTVEGKELRALQLVEVQVDNLEVLELASRDRDMAVVTMQRHKVTITYTDSDWNDISFTREFKVPVGEDMSIISIPTLVANPDAPQSLWITRYELPKLAVAPAAEDAVVVTDDLSALVSL
jgi:hypothetical protein